MRVSAPASLCLRDSRVLTVLLLGAATAAIATSWLVPHAPDVVEAFGNFARRSFFGIEISGRHVYTGFWLGGMLVGGAAYTVAATYQHDAAPGIAYPIFLLAALYGADLQGRLELTPSADALWVPISQLFRARMRLPLGLLLGFGVALSYAVVRSGGGNWRTVGDRLAIGAATWLAFGRIGCLLAGCCAGAVCLSDELGICTTYHAGSPAHEAQVQFQLIPRDAQFSLPVHVLPAYFSIGAAALLAILSTIMVIAKQPGTVLAAFGLLYPALKLSLETMRFVPRPGSVMTVVPLLILALGTGLSLWLARDAMDASET